VSGAARASLGGARPRWPWAVLGAFVALAVTGLWLVGRNGESFRDQVPFVIAFGMFGVVGALILSRVPRNRVGALLLYGAVVTAGAFVTGELFTALVRDGARGGAVVTALGLTSQLGWVFGIMPVMLLLPHLFPDGRVLSARWGRVAWASAGLLVAIGIGSVAGTRSLSGSSEAATVPNPLYVSAFDRIPLADPAIQLMLVGALAAGAASVVVRFRRSRGVERQQLTWVLASLLFLVATFLLGALLEAWRAETFFLSTLLQALAWLSIPVAIAVSVLQYRLYELDVVVKKALIAGVLLVIMGIVAIAVFATFGQFALWRGTPRAVSVAVGAVIGLLFVPVLRLSRRVADRIVYGRRATPYEVLTAFSERVGDAYATEDVLGRMARILREGVGAARARVWLRVGGELRPAATWPPEDRAPSPMALEGDRLPGLGDETAVEVRDQGELLGALSVAMPASDPMNPARERLVRDLASQAGLVLRNVRLLEEVKASQRRLVAAQDQERRRIERNIHDGAQQQLVALAVKMRLARSLATEDGERTAEMLDQLQVETQEALEDLRDLARGIYPPLLADKGLAAALEAQARKSSVPVEVVADGIGRYAPMTEATAYFCVLEALQNVAKYAGASTAVVRLAQDAGHLTFEVRDDGVGFDPTPSGYGSGLRGMADRLGAVDGELTVQSAPGQGTTVRGRIPAIEDAVDGGREGTWDG
jgi:signal transduction histidine kinase